jgi:hypothetical protein
MSKQKITQGDGRPAWERLEALVARLTSGVAAALSGNATLLAILQNRVQQVNPGGVAIPAGGLITNDATILTVGPTGKIRVSAHFTGQIPAATVITALVQIAVAAGAFGTFVPFAQFAAVAGAPGEITDGTVFEFDAAVPAGTLLHVRWLTSAGDGALTLGGGGVAGPIAAALLVEELP